MCPHPMPSSNNMDKNRIIDPNSSCPDNADPNVTRSFIAGASSGKDTISSASIPLNASQRMNLPITTSTVFQGNTNSWKPALYPQKPASAPTLRPLPPLLPKPTLPPLNNYQTLNATFPGIEPSLLVAIVRHEFNPRDIWQLDCRVVAFQRNKELTSSAGAPLAAGAAAVSPVTGLQRFPTLTSLLIPLTLYFRILHTSLLTTHLSRASGLGLNHTTSNVSATSLLIFASSSMQAYLAHLADIAEHYEWDAVLAYHLAFHERRRLDMAVARGQGQEELGCRNWGISDGELMATCLFGRAKQRPTVVRDTSVKRKRPAGAIETQATMPSALPRMIVTPPISAVVADPGPKAIPVMRSAAVARLNENADVKTGCTGENGKKSKGKKKKNPKQVKEHT